jgi:predicted transglutaminase-like cysteine proteinase
MAQLAPMTTDRDDKGRWIVQALHSWGQTITHAREPATAGGEFIMHPHDVAELGLGDCDDVLRAQAAMALSLGLPVAALVLTSTGTRGDGHVSLIVGDHSYAETAVWVVDRLMSQPTALAEVTALYQAERFRGEAGVVPGQTEVVT